MDKPESSANAFVFRVVSASHRVPNSAQYCAYLVKDNWDDWGEYATMFSLTVFDADGIKHELTSVKIGQKGLKPGAWDAKMEGHRRPAIGNRFTTLDENFFSLGQDDAYYVALAKLDEGLRNLIIHALRDIAANLNLWRQVRDERVTRISLLRSVKPKSIEGQFHRLATGGARLTPYELTYVLPAHHGEQPSQELTFNVQPDSSPPTNIHVLIGSNGVGKTHLLQSMTKSLVAGRSNAKKHGKFLTAENETETVSTPIANIVSVSFSAFDNFELLNESRDRIEAIQYSYIGLRKINDTGRGRGTPKTPEALAQEFVSSLKLCLLGNRASRWFSAVETLKSDIIFGAINFRSLHENIDNGSELFSKLAVDIFTPLSSGHKIVLLTVTRLVETVEEQTLVLLDEPEAHLHPPLLSAFIRTLSDLMINRNGVSIIATHSPVVLQEVPQKCVWILQRAGMDLKTTRPPCETFGENVGVLTREVFGLEVVQSGFHRELIDAVNDCDTYEEALIRFDNELGSEARGMLRALLINKKSSKP